MPISLKAGLGGGGGLPKLAPDLAVGLAHKSIELLNSSAVEQLALSLSGKWSVSALGLLLGNGWPTQQGTITVRMEVDGEAIWNGGVASIPGGNADIRLYGRALTKKNTNIDYPLEHAFCCESSLKLYITAPMITTATTLTLNYCARPIK